MSTLNVSNIANPNGTTGLTIDSSGRILKPALPAFRVGLINHQPETSVAGSGYGPIVEWDEGISSETDFCFNQGGFSWSSGVVTVPVAGIYSFSIALRVDAVGDGFVVGRIIKNDDTSANKELYVIDGAPPANYTNLTGTTLYKLAAGDNIRVAVFVENDPNSSWSIANQSIFSGHLLG